jgi:mono/diheme cytochrome c family protein
MKAAKLNVLAAMAVAVLALLTTPALAESEDDGNPALGEELYRSYCRSCHGDGGRGDGPVAEHLKVAPADLTQIARRNDGEFPREWVYERIDGRENVTAHGTSEMPVWGDALSKTQGGLSEEQVNKRITHLVAYLASIQVE